MIKSVFLLLFALFEKVSEDFYTKLNRLYDKVVELKNPLLSDLESTISSYIFKSNEWRSLSKLLRDLTQEDTVMLDRDNYVEGTRINLVTKATKVIEKEGQSGKKIFQLANGKEWFTEMLDEEYLTSNYNMDVKMYGPTPSLSRDELALPKIEKEIEKVKSDRGMMENEGLNYLDSRYGAFVLIEKGLIDQRRILKSRIELFKAFNEINSDQGIPDKKKKLEEKFKEVLEEKKKVLERKKKEELEGKKNEPDGDSSDYDVKNLSEFFNSHILISKDLYDPVNRKYKQNRFEDLEWPQLSEYLNGSISCLRPVTKASQVEHKKNGDANPLILFDLLMNCLVTYSPEAIQKYMGFCSGSYLIQPFESRLRTVFGAFKSLENAYIGLQESNDKVESFFNGDETPKLRLVTVKDHKSTALVIPQNSEFKSCKIKMDVSSKDKIFKTCHEKLMVGIVTDQGGQKKAFIVMHFKEAKKQTELDDIIESLLIPNIMNIKKDYRDEVIPLYIIGDTNLVKKNKMDGFASTEYFKKKVEELFNPGECQSYPNGENQITTSKMRTSMHGQMNKASKCDTVVTEDKDKIFYIPNVHSFKDSKVPIVEEGSNGTSPDSPPASEAPSTESSVAPTEKKTKKLLRARAYDFLFGSKSSGGKQKSKKNIKKQSKKRKANLKKSHRRL